MPDICPDRLRHVRRLAEDADAAFERRRRDAADARTELQRAQRQQEQAHRAPRPQPSAAPSGGGGRTVIRAPAGRQDGRGDHREAADQEVTQAKAALQRVQDEQKAAGERARNARQLWRNCAEYARKRGVELDGVSQPGTPTPPDADSPTTAA